MVDWKDWINKKVFIRTIHGKVYSGIVQDIDENSPPLIWITIIDKYNQIVQIVQSEIAEIKEDGE